MCRVVRGLTRQRGKDKRQTANAAEEHQNNQDKARGDTKRGGDAKRQADGCDGRGGLIQAARFRKRRRLLGMILSTKTKKKEVTK